MIGPIPSIEVDRDRLITEIIEKGIAFDDSRLDVVDTLGRGGNGVAFLCQGQTMGELVAKVYIPPDKRDLDDQSLGRFKNEIKLSAALQHPNVIKSLGSGVLDVGAYSLPFYLMPPAETTLRADVGQISGAGAYSSIVRRFVQACLGVSCLHSNGVIHRDLKPENILVSRQGVPWVADLGIAHIDPDFVSVSLRTVAAERLLNRDYYAPEQRFGAVGDVDRRADIYALGCILYELLVGHPPVRRDSPPVASVDPAYEPLDPIINRMAAYEPTARYPNLEEAIADLALGLGWVAATMTGARQPPRSDIASMEKQLRSSNAVTRKQGVETAVHLGDPALSTLHELMGHGRRDVRNAVAQALGEIGHDSSLSYLLAGLYGGSNRASTFRPTTDEALPAMLRYPAAKRLDAARSLDHQVRPGQILTLLEGVGSSDAYDLVGSLATGGLILFEWAESDLDLLLIVDEDRSWPRLLEEWRRMGGYRLARLLEYVSVERQLTIARLWLAEPGTETWDWERMIPAMLDIPASVAERQTLLPEIEEALDRYPGNQAKISPFRTRIRRVLSELDPG